MRPRESNKFKWGCGDVYANTGAGITIPPPPPALGLGFVPTGGGSLVVVFFSPPFLKPWMPASSGFPPALPPPPNGLGGRA